MTIRNSKAKLMQTGRGKGGVRKRATYKFGRASYYQVKVNRIEAAMMAFIEHVYAKDMNGTPTAFDPMSSQLKIVAPFTRSGYKQYGIKKAEAFAFAKIVKAVNDAGMVPEFVYYKPHQRRWFVNTQNYRNPLQALTWLEQLNMSKHFPYAWSTVTDPKYSGEPIAYG